MDEKRILRIMSGSDKDLTAKGLRLLMQTAEPAYILATAARNTLFNTNIRKPQPLGRPAIAVGNITTGGTGKTPFVTMLAKYLLSQNHKPAILLRGYHSTEQGSDEARAYQTMFKDQVIVEPNPSRIDGAKNVLRNHPQTSVFLLDDAYQHRQAARDLNLVLIDATQPFGYNHVLPRGLLREPIKNLKRADAIILTRADQVENEQLQSIINTISEAAGTPPIAHTAHQWTHLLDINDNKIQLQDIKHKSVAAATGIGNPTAFSHTIKQHTAALLAFDTFPDHHHFTSDDITSLLNNTIKLGAQALLLTEKDYVKWQPLLTDNLKNIIPILRPQLSIRCITGEQDLFNLINQTLHNTQTDQSSN
ncbi:tetraacyldisaccharide 4'-kinase [Planctomycetota bacterium]|nr:tetraacyldisaccharide 4'-kinase [Planctomycetota bacterium]